MSQRSDSDNDSVLSGAPPSIETDSVTETDPGDT